MKTLIIIPSFNTGSYVQGCLKSLVDSQGAESCRVLLVDNGSREDDFLRLCDIADPSPLEINVIRLPENTGYVGGINAGLRWRQGQELAGPVCFLNCDVLLRQRGWLDSWLSLMCENQEIGIIGGGNRRFIGTSKPYDYRTRVDLGVLHTSRWKDIPESCSGECQWVTGTIMLVSPEALAAVPSIDPRYGLGYWDDADYCFEVFWGAGKSIWAHHFNYRHLEMAATKENKYQLSLSVHTKNGFQKMQQLNLRYFYLKWKSVIFARRESLAKEMKHIEFLKALRAAGRIPGSVTKRLRFIQAQQRMGIGVGSQEDA